MYRHINTWRDRGKQGNGRKTPYAHIYIGEKTEKDTSGAVTRPV